MKVIELISENKAEYWSKIKGYDTTKMQDEFSDRSGAAEFLRSKFSGELNKLVSFLTAWVNLARENGFPVKFAEETRRFASTLETSISNISSISEALANANIVLVANKFNKSALYFGSIGRNFEDIGENNLAQTCFKLHKLLEKTAKETFSNIA